MRSTKMSSNMNVELLYFKLCKILSIVLIMNQKPKQAVENFDNHMPPFECPAPTNPDSSMPVHTYK